MKESAQAALSCIRANLVLIETPDFFASNEIPTSIFLLAHPPGKDPPQSLFLKLRTLNSEHRALEFDDALL